MRSLCACLAAPLLVLACDGSPSPAPEPSAEAPAPEAVSPEASSPAVVLPPLSGPVSLTASGVQLDPPAEKDQIPDGAWFCDMGTVHFASTEKNDGICPLCSMELVHQAPAASGEGI